jgi:N-acetylglutamate synthase-like GNAT family acetyltransferase
LDWKRFVVAVNPQGQVIGCGQIKPHGQEILELASIAVEPDYREQGIARAIIEHLISNSPRPLYLMCRSRVGGLYEKFGFRPLGHDGMPRYFQRISKLAGMVASLTRKGESLLIMKLQ